MASSFEKSVKGGTKIKVPYTAGLPLLSAGGLPSPSPSPSALTPLCIATR